MTQSEIKKLQVKEANLWNDLKAWESYIGEKKFDTCKVYAMKLSEWNMCDDILQMLNIPTDFELHTR
tara:strand:- start:1665 stop:1865 length:201 start_codon:yes stop_codon:yes gene_type:complete